MKLQRHGREYLAADFDAGSEVALREVYLELAHRTVEERGDLEGWCRDWSELRSAIDEEGARRYIDYTCHTDDESVHGRYLEWIERLEPPTKSREFALSQKLAEHPRANDLEPGLHRQWLRRVRNSVEIFRAKNVPLETEQARLESEYERIFGSLSVEFEGASHTLPEMARFQEIADRRRREAAYRAVAESVLAVEERLQQLFDDLLELRQRLAQNADCADFRELRFRQLERFSYGPDECLAFHDAVERVALPAVREVHARRRLRLGVARLRPWDLAVDPDGRPPLRPFLHATRLAAGCREIFTRVSPRLGACFRVLEEERLLDLETRPGKAPGGYQYTLQERRLPFIFMNAAGLQRDVQTLLHEGGHAFHALASRDLPLVSLRDAPIEFAEVASMAMELLGAEHLDCFYERESDVRRARITHLEGILELFPWVARIDAFQHWIYTHPGHDAADRGEHWMALAERFSSGVIDEEGLGEFQRTRWLRQPHLFGVPFYYIEYAIAQLGALQVWRGFRRHPARAVESYLDALALGATAPLEELFAAAGARLDFSAPVLEELVGGVLEELHALWGDDDRSA